jgi:Mg/Co/Ni transporter MgtE
LDSSELLFFSGWKEIQLYGQKVKIKLEIQLHFEGLVISTSLFFIVITSVFVGSLLPLILYKIGVDPVHASPTLQVM